MITEGQGRSWNKKSDWGNCNIHGLILFQGIEGVYADYRQEKRKKKKKEPEASASVWLLLYLRTWEGIFFSCLARVALLWKKKNDRSRVVDDLVDLEESKLILGISRESSKRWI